MSVDEATVERMTQIHDIIISQMVPQVMAVLEDFEPQEQSHSIGMAIAESFLMAVMLQFVKPECYDSVAEKLLEHIKFRLASSLLDEQANVQIDSRSYQN